MHQCFKNFGAPIYRSVFEAYFPHEMVSALARGDKLRYSLHILKNEVIFAVVNVDCLVIDDSTRCEQGKAGRAAEYPGLTGGAVDAIEGTGSNMLVMPSFTYGHMSRKKRRCHARKHGYWFRSYQMQLIDFLAKLWWELAKETQVHRLNFMGRHVGNVVSRGLDGRRRRLQDFKEDALIKQKENVRESCLGKQLRRKVLGRCLGESCVKNNCGFD